MLKKFIIALALIVLPLTASADVIEPGQKYVGFCFELSGANLYSEYTLIGVPSLSGEPKIIIPGECTGFYKFATVTIKAIRTESFDQTTFTANPTSYMAAQSGVASSNISIPMESQTVDDSNPLSGIKAVYAITNIADRRVMLEKTQMVYTNTDGTSRTEIVDPTAVNTNRPANSNGRNGGKLNTTDPEKQDSNTIYYILIPAGGGILIALILLLRKK